MYSQLLRLPSRATLRQAVTGVWGFPLLLLLTLIILTALRINGSSVGMYHSFVYGSSQQDPALLEGQPRPIRSDEWGVNTPAIVSQAKEGYPVVNQTVGHGQDMSVTFDVPTKELGSLFKPQNWAFFVLPLEYAFAFKWWLLGVILMLACYAFFLTFLPRQYLLSALISVALFLSPFIQWWYQSITILPLAYGLLIAALVIRYYNYQGRISRRQIALLSAIGYITTCFAITLYVPFVVPVGLGLTALLGGHLLNKWRAGSATTKQLILRQSWLLVGVVLIVGLIAGLYLHSHSTAIEAIGNTVYPGDRTQASGGLPVSQFLGGYYNIYLQDDNRASHIDFNQSEASNFIYLSLFLIPCLVFLLVKRRSLELSFDWRIVGLLLVATAFLVRLFVPFSEIIFDALQLNRIPHNRLLIGFGFINLCLLAISLQHITKQKLLPSRLRWVSVSLAAIVTLSVGLSLKLQHNGYLESILAVVVISATLSTTTWLLVNKRLIAGALLLACFSFLSVAHVNPLYRGLGMLTHSSLVDTMRSLDDNKTKWVVGDYAASFESLPSASGVTSLSGVYAYPQLDVWRPIAADPASEAVYNRYAHVFFTVGTLQQPALGKGAYFDPPALDAFRVHADPCSEFLQAENVRYLLATQETASPCLALTKKITYPKQTFYIYSVDFAAKPAAN